MPEIIKLQEVDTIRGEESSRAKMVAILGQDLNFHGQVSGYASHNFHSFPAKFPPQIPRKFIDAFTNPGDTVLDPMMGSGTTILEAFLAGRQAIGVDIDPLSLLVSKVKVTPVNFQEVNIIGDHILCEAELALRDDRQRIEKILDNRWDLKTKQFINYWFAPETQLELQALVEQIEKTADKDARDFFVLAFSSIIITKSGGVSLALDLGHTRPHKAKIVLNKAGQSIVGKTLRDSLTEREKVLSKTIGSPLEEFRRRIHKNLNGLPEVGKGTLVPQLALGNAQCLPTEDASVDLIVTSPPYASNAIDYMRAHKFSLVWLGHTLSSLSERRREYIGGEAIINEHWESLPPGPAEIVEQIGASDAKKGRVLHRYYSEMTRSLREMYRVLKPGKIAFVVVGTSVMRGRNTETANCLAEIGKSVGFDVPRIGTRSLDRDRRMMPVGTTPDLDSQIQQRMHEEYVIGYLKPDTVQRHCGINRWNS